MTSSDRLRNGTGRDLPGRSSSLRNSANGITLSNRPTDATYFLHITKYKEPYYLARFLESGFHRPEDPVELDGFLFNDFCSLFDYLEMVFVQGVREFEEFFAKNPITDWIPDLDESMHFESCILDYLTS